MASKSRLSRKWWWLSLSLLALLGLVGAFSALSWGLADPTVLFESEIARLRAAGHATTPEEWNSDPPAPGENAAPEIDAADAWLIAFVGDRDTWKSPGPWHGDPQERWWEGLDASEAADLEAFLAALEPYFDRVESALQRPRAWWPLAFDENGMVTSRELPRVQRLVSLHHARTWSRTGGWHPGTPIRVRLRLSRAIERPWLFMGMVAMACAESAARDVRDVLAEGKAAASELRAELDEHLRITLSDRMPSLVRAEIVNSTAMLTQFESTGIIDADGKRIRRIDSMGNRLVTRLWFGGPPDMLRALSEAAEIDDPTYSVRRRRFIEIDRDAPGFAQTATLAFPIIVRKAARADANLRLARIALAATERRETTGAWPASLDDLRDMFPDGVPLDPFTERAFVYEVRGGALRIASAGRCDDEPAVSEQQLIDDGLVWTIER
jgi:hypothetical protein